jgi:hypothetical protein
MVNRRSFLASLAASSILSSTEAFAAKKKVEPRVNLKKNVVFINLDLGLYGPNFRDGGASSKYMTEHFSEFKGQMTYFDGVSEPGMGGGHECQRASFTALKYEHREHYPEKLMMSIDQVLADGSIQETRHKSIYHTINHGANKMSWNRFEQPVISIDGANELYDTLFSRSDTRLDKARIRRERDILSTLARNLRRFWKGSPQEETMKNSLDYHLAVLDEREKWLKVSKPYLKKSFGEKDQDKPIPSSLNNFNLIYDALEKKQTKIALLQFGANRLQNGLNGVELGHHGNTHHGNYPERIRGLETIDAGVLNNVTNFLHKLKEGGLYDETIVLFYCGMSNACHHDNKRAPAFLFGGGFEHKESIQCLDDSKKHIYRTSNMFNTVLKQSGFSSPKFQNDPTIVKELFRA